MNTLDALKTVDYITQIALLFAHRGQSEGARLAVCRRYDLESYATRKSTIESLSFLSQFDTEISRLQQARFMLAGAARGGHFRSANAGVAPGAPRDARWDKLRKTMN